MGEDQCGGGGGWGEGVLLREEGGLEGVGLMLDATKTERGVMIL